MRRRVLVLTRDLIPLPGMSVGGGGLRAWGLGEALRARGHDVVYSVPRALVPDGAEHDQLREMAFEADDIHTVQLRSEADLVLIEQWGLATFLQDTTLPVVLDLHGSLILENAFRRHRSLTSNAAAKIKALQKADLVLCPAHRQRAYFMSWMMMSGADPQRIPVEVVPVSMPPELPERTADYGDAEPLQLVYGGLLWPWIDPDLALLVTADVLEETGAGTCYLFVEEPKQQDVMPHDTSTRVKARRLPERVRRSEAMKVEGLIPRDRLVSRYTAAHLAVDLYTKNIERELAFTTRTVEYLWCGLPVLYGDYGELAGLIDRYQAGWVVSPEDPAAIRAALTEAIEDREELRRRSENARRLVAENLTWDRTVDPLDRFVRDPIVREKGSTIFGKLALEFDRIASETSERVRGLETEVRRLVKEVETRDGRIVALTDELAYQDRRLSELTERHGHELSQRELEIRHLESSTEQQRRAAVEQAGELEQVKEMLRCEQDEHARTSASLEATRHQLGKAARVLEQREEEIEVLQTDLKGAAEKIELQAAAAEQQVERLEQMLRDCADQELEAKSDLAAGAGEREQMRLELARSQKDNERLRRQIGDLRRDLSQLKESWIQRTVATSEHSFKRVARQVPTLAGLFIRNLANNAYMAVWQRRHNVRIFPGQ